jgi:hypothetical protein
MGLTSFVIFCNLFDCTEAGPPRQVVNISAEKENEKFGGKLLTIEKKLI